MSATDTLGSQIFVLLLLAGVAHPPPLSDVPSSPACIRKRSWAAVAQGMFPLCEINQTERKVCSYLEWELI
jgi:hypothetical protein